MTGPLISRRALSVGGLAFAAFVQSSGRAFSDDYPDRTVRIIVPYSAGGPADIFARAIGRRFNEIWKQPFIVENRPGAGGTVGADYVVRSPADGYTLLLSNMSDAISVSLYPLSYNLLTDLKPIVDVASTPFIIAVPSSLPAKSLKELVALAKTQKLTFASAGVGTVGHVAAELFKSMAEIDAVHVPYKGQGPAMSDLLAGRVDFMFSNPMVTIPLVREGSLRGLAVTSTTRMAAAPEIPTVSESWRAGFDVTPWFGLQGPKGLPSQIVQQLSDAIAAVLKLDDFRNELAAIGATPLFESSADFATRIANDVKKWGEVVKISKAKEN